MKFANGKERRAIFWSIGIVVGLLLFLVIAKYQTPSVHLEDTFRNILEKNEILSQIRTHFLQSVEMEKNAVMAQTDEESQKFADESFASSAVVEKNLKQLQSLIDAAPLQDEKKIVVEFATCWTELRRLDQTILELAVQNTNLKAASLSRGKGAEVMQRFEDALEDVMRSYLGDPNESRVTRLSYHAITAGLKIYNLHSPHIAEASDEKMDQIEAQMNTEKNEVLKSLDELSEIVGKENMDALPKAKAAFSEFIEVTAKVIILSRQNSNVKSLDLSLGRKRKVSAQCDEILANLQEIAHNRTFKATR